MTTSKTTPERTHARRRSYDTLREVDGLLETHLAGGHVGAQPLANLAAAMAIQYSGADRGALFLHRGNGLAPVIALENDLSATSESDARHDLALIEEASACGETRTAVGKIAAPVRLGGGATCVLYLEGAPEQLDAEAVALADGVAARIGSLLRSAKLVEELARSTRNLATLEALGACLAAGELQREHLEQTVEGALEATGSDDALLVLLEPPGSGAVATARGASAGELERLGERWGERLRRGRRLDIDAARDGRRLVEPFYSELVSAGRGPRQPLGLLAVRRRDQRPEYAEGDRSFVRAVAHLLAGALARREYFTRAAEDPLTETGSRLALQLALAEAQADAAATGLPCSLLLLDLDQFKEINDRWGHSTGDQVLRELAAALRSRLRATDSVARYGGDEFVLILPRTGAEQARALGEELRALIGRRPLTDRRLRLTVSIGLATGAGGGCDLQEVLEAADRALYRSKADGRDRVTHSDDPGG